MKQEPDYSSELIQHRLRQAMHDRIDKINKGDTYVFIHRVQKPNFDQSFCTGGGDKIALIESVVTLLQEFEIPLPVLAMVWMTKDRTFTFDVDLSKTTMSEAEKEAYEQYKKNRKP